MTQKEASDICGNKWLQYPRRVPFLSIMRKYPELSLIDMSILEFMLIFTHWEHVLREVSEGIQYYWCDYDTVLAHIYCKDCTSIASLKRHIEVLCGAISDRDEVDTRPFFLKKLVKNTQHGKRVFFAFTEDARLMYGESPVAVQMSNRAIEKPPVEDDGTESSVVLPEVDWIPSENLVKFRDAVFASTTRFSGDGSFFKGDDPVKYWQSVDNYIEALLNGTFVSTYGTNFTKKVSDFSSLTIEQVIDATNNCCITGKKRVSIDKVFIPFQGKYSTIYNYLEKKLGAPAKVSTKGYKGVPLTSVQTRAVSTAYNSSDFHYRTSGGVTEDQILSLGGKFEEYIQDNKDALIAQNRRLPGYVDVFHFVKRFLWFAEYKIENEKWKNTTFKEIFDTFMVGINGNPCWDEFGKYCATHHEDVKVVINSKIYKAIDHAALIEATPHMPTEKEIQWALDEEEDY